MAVVGAERSQTGHAGGSDRLVFNVPAALVAAKLAPPVSTSKLLPRSELVTRLTESTEKLCLISAPAGWGKNAFAPAGSRSELTDGRA